MFLATSWQPMLNGSGRPRLPEIMTYRVTYGTVRWKLAPLKFDLLNRRQLWRAGKDAWAGPCIYASADAAMGAIANGSTGVGPGDADTHEFVAAKWTAEGW